MYDSAGCSEYNGEMEEKNAEDRLQHFLTK